MAAKMLNDAVMKIVNSDIFNLK